MARFTLYTDFDARFEARNDTEAIAFAETVVAVFEEACEKLPRYERQFTNVELRRGVRGKRLIDREEGENE